MHPIGFQEFHGLVPLPLNVGDQDEESYYYFLAQVSLRKLMTEVLETVGFRGKSS